MSGEMSSFQDVRDLAVRVGDGLVFLMMTSLSEYPTPGGMTFEKKATQASSRLEALVGRTRVKWKKDLLLLVQQELAEGIRKGRSGDDDGSHRLFADAEMHFTQYERGDAPEVTFTVGPDGTLTKNDK